MRIFGSDALYTWEIDWIGHLIGSDFGARIEPFIPDAADTPDDSVLIVNQNLLMALPHPISPAGHGCSIAGEIDAG